MRFCFYVMMIYVQLKVRGVIKSFLAIRTVISELVAMNPAVRLELKPSAEKLAAGCALEGSFVAVRRGMFFEVLPRAVTSPADHAQMREIHRVCSLMYLEALQLREAFATVLTHIGFNSGMNFHVALVIGRVTEFVVANVTFGDDDSFVHATDVSLKEVKLAELLSAYVTNE